MRFQTLLLALVLVLFSTSCIQKKHLLYLQGTGETANTIPLKKPEYKIQPGDILHINIITIDQALLEYSDKQNSIIQSGAVTEPGLFLTGYVVNDSGYVNLPLIGMVKVAQTSLMEVKQIIQQEVDKFYREASVDIKLVSYRFTILGEVFRPGTYINYHDRLNVFEAIARAGNLTDLAGRRVLLIRPLPEGNQTIRLNLADNSILSSEYFYLLPNDVLIVEPGHGKTFRMNVPIFTLSFSALSALFLLINYFNQ